jgi:hypothetical protein
MTKAEETRLANILRKQGSVPLTKRDLSALRKLSDKKRAEAQVKVN